MCIEAIEKVRNFTGKHTLHLLYTDSINVLIISGNSMLAHDNIRVVSNPTHKMVIHLTLVVFFLDWRKKTGEKTRRITDMQLISRSDTKYNSLLDHCSQEVMPEYCQT